jgi:hypothetical protein
MYSTSVTSRGELLRGFEESCGGGRAVGDNKAIEGWWVLPEVVLLASRSGRTEEMPIHPLHPMPCTQAAVSSNVSFVSQPSEHPRSHLITSLA